MATAAKRIEGEVDGALEALYRAHYPALIRLGFLLTGSNEAAEDVVHDVFLRVGSRLPVDHPASYLRSAVVNACRSQHRRAVVARRHAPPPAPLVMPRELVDFRDVLLGLTLRQRTAIVLRYFCEMDDAAIAEVLDCRPATVRTLVHRGLASLRAVLS